jgi:FtsP/CotA-like multicopper oxidase with cupredoxin domain
MGAMVEQRRETLFVGALVAALVAVVAAAVAVGLSARALGNGGDDSGATAGAPASVSATLEEFAIKPATLRVAAGGAIEVHNAGNVAHDLAVEGTDLAVPLIDPGGHGRLDLAGLAPGTYTLHCTVPGHADAGMRATLQVTTAGGAAQAKVGTETSHRMSADEMDAAMAARTKAFPAKTEGTGGQLMAPKVLPDGTKKFELTAKIVDWEVEPGKKVKAWTYNGTVPGPTIRVEPGDRVRVVLHNELPESTSIHFHGLVTPNSMDGVPDITQPPVKPGESFTYEFVARGPAVGMYHSHHDAVKQVPNGLAGAFLVGRVPLPAGVSVSQELPMFLHDSGTIGYALNGKSFPATAPISANRGDWVLVHYLNEGTQIHPMHLHGLPQLVVAKDGNALPQPYEADTILVSPGERYSVLVHATEPGVWAWHCHILTHAEREDGMFGMVTAMIVS